MMVAALPLTRGEGWVRREEEEERVPHSRPWAVSTWKHQCRVDSNSSWWGCGGVGVWG